MDFLKKAKQSMKELEADLNKATTALGLGDKDASTDGSSAPGAPTPGTSVTTGEPTAAATTAAAAPSGDVNLKIAAGTTNTGKPPMTVRKNIRDEWDNKREELSKQASDLLQTKWECYADAATIWTYSKDGYAKERTGTMVYEYFNMALLRLKTWLAKHGDDGRNSINKLAPQHYLTLEPGTDFKYCGSDFTDGKLRIVFNPDNLGTNVGNGFDELDAAVTSAEKSGAHGGVAIPFTTRADIAKRWDPAYQAVLTAARERLNRPDLKFEPNFEENYATIKTWQEANKKLAANEMGVKNWEENFGFMHQSYFSGFNGILGRKKFEDDDMLQEGFFEAAPTATVKLRVVDASKLRTTRRCECVFEDGILYLQTQPKNWGVNVDDACEDILELI